MEHRQALFANLVFGLFFLSLGIYSIRKGEIFIGRSGFGVLVQRSRAPVRFWLCVVPIVGIGFLLLYFCLRDAV
jgi:hypothetical protein